MNDKHGSNRLPILAAEIISAHVEARRMAETSVGYAIKAGEALLEAKGIMKHGEWLPWLRDNCQMSKRTAQLYIRLAVHKDHLPNAQRVALLSLRAMIDVLTEPKLNPRLAEGKALAEGVHKALVRVLDALEQKMEQHREFAEMFFQLSPEAQEAFLAAEPNYKRWELKRWSEISRTDILKARWSFTEAVMG